jgi:hypothetical protein
MRREVTCVPQDPRDHLLLVIPKFPGLHSCALESEHQDCRHRLDRDELQERRPAE